MKPTDVPDKTASRRGGSKPARSPRADAKRTDPDRAALDQARRSIDATLSRDRGRLHGLWSRWRAKPSDATARAAFEKARDSSLNQCRQRASQLPQVPVDPSLPIASQAERIVALLREHQVVVIAGETGSGKTTQLPKLCLAAGRGAAGMIGCTQPRRIAARAVAKRVAEELHTPLGGLVGYQVRFNEKVSESTAIKFMTDGILLAEIQSDRWLSRYDTILIDEAHERSLNIDFLLGYLKQLLKKRRDLKVIVTSATIDTTRFSEHFDDAPVVDVEGRGHPVSVRYRERGSESLSSGQQSAGGQSGKESDSDPLSVLSGIVAACDEITSEDPRGDVLIFLPGEREIRDAHQALERRKYRHTEVLPLYARLSVRDQDRVFNPGTQRRIVLATNVAETSLTVPRIRYVVDPGVARIKRYSPRSKLDRLRIEPVSQASADQRKGRCGRVSEGTCYRLYSEADFESRPAYTDPEIRRAALAGVILRMLSLGLGDIDDFPFLEPPEPRAVADGWQQLGELGAVEVASDKAARNQLTATGRLMARMPVDVKLARMLVAANARGCLREMLVIASFLGIQDPRERPADQRAAADNAHVRFVDYNSEFVGTLKLWAAYQETHEASTQSQLRRWCEKNFLGFLRMREWRELHRQLKLMAGDLGWMPSSQQTPELDAGAYANLHRALIAGLPTQIGHRVPPAENKTPAKGAGKKPGERKPAPFYDGPRGRKFQLFPGSWLIRKPPPWVLSATLLDTEKVWAMSNASIEPQWAIDELPHLLARRHHDPRWSRSQGRVLGSEQVSLFGLVLAPKRPIHYGGLYPEESRAIFARDALVTGEINTRSVFLARNLAMLDKAREEEAKQRRAGLVVDEDWMADWYLQRLPPDVHNAQALDAWYGKLPATQKATLEWALDDLLVGDETDATRFPPQIALGEAQLAVSYRFEPGAPDDGMTVSVPLHLLNALDPARLGWLAPGFTQDKAIALIKRLPKAQRRNFVPAPDFAKAFHEAHPGPEPEPMTRVLAGFLKQITGAAVTADQFDESGLEPHLRANLRLLDVPDKRGEAVVLAESRDLGELRERFGERSTRAFAAHAADGLGQNGLLSFPDDAIPASLPGAAGMPAYPALHDDGDSVSLQVHAEREIAQHHHPSGVRRLLWLALGDARKQARKQLPISAKTGLLYAAIESAAPRPKGPRDGDHLRSDLVDGAFAALVADGLDEIRDIVAFTARRDAVAKRLFAESMERLQQAEIILAAVSQARASLESPLMGWAGANLDDMRGQLAGLTPPGFLGDVPAPALVEYPRYLKALALRGERALRDPVRDQARMLELKPFADALAAANASGEANATPWQALRWDLEELRVSLFAQELGSRGVSPKKLAARLAKLRP